MTCYGPKELAASFRTVRNNTIQIAQEIPEEHYGYRITPESRTVAETLAHIALTPRVQEQIHIAERRHTLVGFDFFGFLEKQIAEEQTRRSKEQILELLRTEGERYAQILENVSEELLAERVEYPQGMIPPVKSRFEMLMSPKEHEMHHRGQLMVIQRMLGLTPHLTRRMQEVVAAAKAAQGTA